MVGDDVKLPLFNGNETKDPKQYWFIYEVVCTVKQSKDKDIKKDQLVTTCRGRTLECYEVCIIFDGESIKESSRE